VVRRILCPTDFSDFSARALAHATAFARWYGARITLLYVSPLIPPVGAFPPLVSSVAVEPLSRERALDDLRAFGASAAAAGVPMDAVVRDGSAGARILEEASEANADLVVMGTHGRGGFERLVLGSVAEKVLRKSPCPVLTVSRPAHDRTPHEPPELRRVLCATDLSPASREALRSAVSLARLSGARLTVLNVVDWPQQEVPGPDFFDVPAYRRHLEADAARQLGEEVSGEAAQCRGVREVVAAGTPWREVLRVAADDDAELIVIGVHGRNALDRLLFGSTAQHVVRQASCPVLTVRPRAGGKGP
jgi:nucleotide-binding universal stress UspA family protein